jgi:predicted RNA-binding Zn-ribbon protein involved in translation (DUF1610 family)
MTALEMHKKMFPQVSLNFYQMDLVEVEIDDLGAWKETLKFWASNDYRGQSVGKMIDYYNKLITDRVKQNASAMVGKYIPEPDEVTYKDCKTCDNTRRIGDWMTGIRCPDCTDVELIAQAQTSRHTAINEENDGHKDNERVIGRDAG